LSANNKNQRKIAPFKIFVIFVAIMINFEENVSLKSFNTFGIDAKARYFTRVSSVDDIRELLRTSLYQQTKHLVVGGGSNLLLTRDFDGLVIQMNIRGITVVRETDTHVTLVAGAGEVWHALVMHCVKNNWGGIENLSLIPGTVGAAPMQNIGAYGVEVKDVIDQVDGIDAKTGDACSFSNAECAFGYRESIFKHAWKEKIFISSVTLTLTKKNHRLITSYGAIQDTLNAMHVAIPTIQNISDAVISIRQQKLPDPHVLGNAGSFFKNPSISAEHFERLKSLHASIPGYKTENQQVKVPAAWLIEQCGWKGKRRGNVGVHAHQPLVLVNFGGGTGDEIRTLAGDIQASVKERFDVLLQPEVNII
jgi:UDP-N-acetylmuramate dehydrogenase